MRWRGMHGAGRADRAGLLALVVTVVILLFAPTARAADRFELAAWTLRIPSSEAGPAREVPIRLPTHFDRLLPARPITVVLHADVTLPPELRAQPLTLAIPYFPGQTALRVDGESAAALEDDVAHGYRRRGPQAYRIVPAGREHLALDLVVEHTWVQSGWFDTVPRLLPAGERDGQTIAVKLMNDVAGALAFAALVQLGSTYLAIFLAGRRRRAYVWFALQVFAASTLHFYYLGFSQAVFGRYDVAVLGICVPAAGFFAVRFTHAQFGLGPPSRFFLALFLVDAAAALLWPGPFGATSHAGRTTILTVGIVVVYQLVTLGRLTLRRPRPLGAETILASWVVLGVMSFFDGAAWLGFGELLGGVRGDCIALAVFAWMQSLLLGREHIGSLNRSDQLNAQLGERVVLLEERQLENQQLTEELRRQIADRSRQLFAALALIGDKRESPALQPGDVVQERYQVVRVLGQGGMGTVYEVRRTLDDARLALKLTRDLDGPALARLAREAQIASHVHHPNVVDIVDVDVATGGFLYLVLEYVEGSTLRTLTARFDDADLAVDVLRQIAEGLAALHERGIVHRDLKPANVLVVDPGSFRPGVKITDFGISRLVADPLAASGTTAIPVHLAHADEDDETLSVAMRPALQEGSLPSMPTASTAESPLTEVGLLVGTPKYMAPELARAPGLLHAAADVFSFGVMAYDLLAGVAPFDLAPTVAELEGRAWVVPGSIGNHRPELDASVVLALDACLDREPAARPTAADLARIFSSVSRTNHASNVRVTSGSRYRKVPC